MSGDGAKKGTLGAGFQLQVLRKEGSCLRALPCLRFVRQELKVLSILGQPCGRILTLPYQASGVIFILRIERALNPLAEYRQRLADLAVLNSSYPATSSSQLTSQR